MSNLNSRTGFGDGTAGLDVMEHAHRYNAAIEDEIDACLTPRLGASPRVLDVGAGTGEFARRMRARGWTVVCVEPDAYCADVLRSEGFEVHTDLSDIRDAEALDGAYLVNVLEHIENDVAFLRQIRALLRVGARLYVWVPAFEVLYSDHDFELGHYRRYRRQTLRRVVELAGYRVKKTGYRDSLGWLAALAWRLRPAKAGGTASAGAIETYDKWIFPASAAIDGIASHLAGKNVVVWAERE